MAENNHKSQNQTLSAYSKEKNKHRRTQSNSALDMDAILNRKRNIELQESNMQGYPSELVNATQKAIDAAKFTSAEKEVIIDDIDEVPENGYVVPRYPCSSNNPLNFVKKRDLISVFSKRANNEGPKKINFHIETTRLNDLTGLNTIYEKKNSIEDIDPEDEYFNDSKRSPVSKRSSHSDKFEITKFQKSSTPKRVYGTQEMRKSIEDKEVDHNNLRLSSRNHADSSYSQSLTLENIEKMSSKKSDSRNSSKENKNVINSIDSIKEKMRKKKPEYQGSFDAKYMYSIVEKFRQNLHTQDNKLSFGKQIRLIRNSKKVIGSPSKSIETVYRSKTPQNSNGIVNPAHEFAFSHLNNSKSTKSCQSFTPQLSEVYANNHANNDENIRKLQDKTTFLEREVKFLLEVIEGLKNDKLALKKKIKEQDGKIQNLQKNNALYEQKIKVINSKKKFFTLNRDFTKEDSLSLNFLNTTENTTLESPYNNSSFNKNVQVKKSAVTPFSLFVPYADSHPNINLQNSKKFITLKQDSEFKTILKSSIIKISMSKFFKRLGTKSIKYIVSLTLNKVILNITQPVKVAVEVQRGEHTFQSNPATAGGSHEINFDHEFKIPVTMYYDKKKQVFQEKEKTILTLKIIAPNKVIVAGITKFDLSSYLNTKKEQHDILNIDKCNDKKAKFDITLKFILSESSKKEVSTDRSKLNDRSIDNDHSRDNSDDSHDLEKNSSDEEENDKRARSADPKGPKALKDFFNPKMNQNSKEEKLNSNGTTNGEITVINNTSVRTLEQKVKDLENKISSFKKENDNLLSEIQNLKSEKEKFRVENEKLKTFNKELKTEIEILRNDMKVENTFEERVYFEKFIYVSKEGIASKGYKEKVLELQEDIEELKLEKKKFRDQIEELTKLNDELVYKMENLQKKDKQKNNLESLEIEKLKETIEDLTTRIKNSEMNLRNTKESLQKEIDNLEINKSELETKVRQIQRENSSKDTMINELHATNASLKTENEIYKKKNSGGSTDFSKYIRQIEELQLNHKNLEEEYKRKIEELEKELAQNKQDISKKKIEISPSVKTDIIQLEQEIERLNKKIKDLENKNKGKTACQCDDYRNQITILKSEKGILQEEIINLKNPKHNDDNSQKFSQKIREQEELIRELQSKIEDLMVQIFKLKSKIGSLMNAALESGVPELLESFEMILSSS